MARDKALPMNVVYDEFIHEIVISAVNDYRVALKRLKRNKNNLSAMRQKLDCERFFSSAWCRQLTDVDMVKAAQYIRKEVYET